MASRFSLMPPAETPSLIRNYHRYHPERKAQRQFSVVGLSKYMMGEWEIHGSGLILTFAKPPIGPRFEVRNGAHCPWG